MGDPLTDPRAQALLNTSPSELDGLASFFQRVAGEARNASSGLQGAHGDETWTGGAASAFRTQLGKLPGDLSNVEQSYSDVASALRTYSSQVEPIRSQFQTVYNQLQSAQGNLTSAQGGLQTAQGNLSSAQNAPKAKPSDPAVKSATTAVGTARGTVNRLQSEVTGLDTHGCHLLDEFDTVRGACSSAVKRAGDRAPQHHSSFFGSICHIADDVGHFVAKAGEAIGASFKNVFDGHDIMAFIEHPSWKTFGQLARDVATVASVVAIAAAPFAAPELLGADATEAGAEGAAEAGADGAADGATDGAAGAGEGAGDGASGGKSTWQSFREGAARVNSQGTNVARAANVYSVESDIGQGDYKGALIDGAFTAAGFSDKAVDALGLGDGTAEEAKAAAESTARYQDFRDAGIPDGAARDLAFGDEVPSWASGAQPPTAQQVASTLSSQLGAANTAAARALHIGQPLGFAIDTLGIDPAKDKVRAYAGAAADG
jgi:uncharacterized protein YukE